MKKKPNKTKPSKYNQKTTKQREKNQTIYHKLKIETKGLRHVLIILQYTFVRMCKKYIAQEIHWKSHNGGPLVGTTKTMHLATAGVAR
jgi:hypothetical protein